MAENVLIKLFAWLLRWRQISVAVLVGLVLMSAVGVTLAAHHTRQMYTQLQEIRATSDNLDSEYEKLLLEQSAWGDYARVDRVARADLGMEPPSLDNMVIVKR